MSRPNQIVLLEMIIPQWGKLAVMPAKEYWHPLPAHQPPLNLMSKQDLSCAGVLLSLPALLSNGLLSHSKDFKLEKVYYSEEVVFLCLAFLSLLRVKNINQANNIPCGELGRVMGLDRIPEVKTLRERIARFTAKEM